MDISERLYVEIAPLEGDRSPHPHPVREARFDPRLVYKVLGMYNPSETSECYFILSNPERQIWFISQRHLRAFGLFDGDALFFEKEEARTPGSNGQAHTSNGSNGSNGNGASHDHSLSPGTSSKNLSRMSLD